MIFDGPLGMQCDIPIKSVFVTGADGQPFLQTSYYGVFSFEPIAAWRKKHIQSN